MGQTVRIPIEDGGWIEVDETDPRAIGYMKRFKSEGVPQRSASPVRHQRIARSGIYMVQPGDTLGNIAKDLLGDTRLFSKIAELNQLPDPNLILVGQHLVIPERAASAGTAPSIEPGGASAAKPPSTSGQAPVTPLAKPKNMSAAAGGTPATLALARGFQFYLLRAAARDWCCDTHHSKGCNHPQKLRLSVAAWTRTAVRGSRPRCGQPIATQPDWNSNARGAYAELRPGRQPIFVSQ